MAFFLLFDDNVRGSPQNSKRHKSLTTLCSTSMNILHSRRPSPMDFVKIILLTNFFFDSVALSGLYFWWLITAFFLVDFFRHLFRGIRTTGKIVGYGKKSTNNSVYFPV